MFSQYSLLLSMIFMVISFITYAFTPEIKKQKTNNTDNIATGLLKLLRAANYNVINYVT